MKLIISWNTALLKIRMSLTNVNTVIDFFSFHAPISLFLFVPLISLKIKKHIGEQSIVFLKIISMLIFLSNKDKWYITQFFLLYYEDFYM